MSSQLQLLEALERAVNEIDALEAIYGNDGGEDDAGSSFSVFSMSELEAARSALEAEAVEEERVIPQLELKVHTSVETDAGEKINLSLHCRLPPGYPEQAPALVSASLDGLRRSLREDLSSHLNRKAESMVGFEAVMELVEELREVAPSYLVKEQSLLAERGAKRQDSQDEKKTDMFGRRWIWVHHIKDSDRRKSIVSEARELKLGGYLKSGYPGIIVIEGDASACDEFVSWVKGNKSRPGGFGRNWGHHVRGEINFPTGTRYLPLEFEELEDLAVLGGLCKEHGLEAEFLDYVLQH
jgi:hypothetical protein